MHHIRFRLGLCPRPRWGKGADSAPPDLAGFEGPTSKGRDGKGRGGEERGGKGRGLLWGRVKGKEERVDRGGKGRGREWKGIMGLVPHLSKRGCASPPQLVLPL